MPVHDPDRRRLILTSLALPWIATLPACSTPLPLLKNETSDPAARDVLLKSAEAHGMHAFAAIRDVSLRYEGHWRPVVGKLQPALVDAGFRGGSEERLLLSNGIVAQVHTGPSGRKVVLRESEDGAVGRVRVWFNGEEAHDGERRSAAALVVDGYSLFLLGPLLLAGRWSGRRIPVLASGGVQKMTLDGRKVECDVIRLRLLPGLGFSAADDMALFISREDRLLRCVRFTLNGLESTQGAIAEVHISDHRKIHGVQWPTTFYERLLRPVPLPVHNWRLTGLDIDRGLKPADVMSGTGFEGAAVRPAEALPRP